MALTPKGRQLYDDLLRNAGTGQDNLTHQMHLQETFRTFPDSEFLMRQQGLGWFRYRLTPSGEAHRQAIHPGDDPQPLIERGWVVAQPITYEDFLPVSAAGSSSQIWVMKRRHAITVMPVAKHLSRRWGVRFWMSSSFIRKRKNAVNVAVVCFKF